MSIKIEAITDNRIILSDEISHCENCKKPMIRWYSPFAKINVPSFDIVFGTYRETGVCEKCVKNGQYPKICCICYETKMYPEQFSYELIDHPPYPEEETEYNFVCTQCAEEKQREVIESLVSADETKRVSTRGYRSSRF